MTHRTLDEALRAADPLPRDAAERLPLSGAEHAMLDAVVAHDAPHARRRPRPTRRWALAVAAAAAAVVAALAVGPAGDHRGDDAFAAELVRFAEASPLVLLDVPGWKVDYANEQTADDGELHFLHGDAPAASMDVTVHADGTYDGPSVAERQRHAQLRWLPAEREQMWLRDRGMSAERRSSAPVLDTTAHVFVYAGGKPGDRDVTAIFRYADRLLEFRAAVPDLAAFERLLAGLRAVDTDTWLRALPASVVVAADREGVMAEMLRGIPLPPGFGPDDLPDDALTRDRYQLGALVAGAVACRWFARWGEARARGDAAAEQAAVRAMSTAADWPILKDMADEGGYTEVLVGYANAMRRGEWYGRPLLGDVDEGLGCAERGVSLR